MVANIVVILVVVLGAVGWIAFQVHRSMLQNDSLQETSANGAGKNPSAAAATPAPVLEAPPTSPPPSLGLLETASLLLLRKDFEKCGEALALAELELMRLRGLLAFETGQPGVAEEIFVKVSDHPNRIANDFINLATVRLALGKKAEAIEAFESARSCDPDDDYAANRYYLGLLQVGEVERAEEIHVALQIAPSNALSQVALTAAILHLHRGQNSKAVEFVRAAKSVLSDQVFQALMQEPLIHELSQLLVAASSKE